MLRYMLVAILVNLYGHSLGIPAPVKEDNGKMKIAKELFDLANECGVSFIGQEIKGHIKDCEFIVSDGDPENPAALPCLLYYDMNSRLCNTLKYNKISQLTEENKAKLSQKNILDDVCSQTKNWSVGEIQNYPPYKVSMEKIFYSKSPSHCIRFCGVPKLVFSDDVNYFCNYFIWGQEYLNQLQTLHKPSAAETPKNITQQALIPESEQPVGKIDDPTIIQTGTGVTPNITAPAIIPPSQENLDIEVVKNHHAMPSDKLKNTEIIEKPKQSLIKSGQIQLPEIKVDKTEKNVQTVEDKQNIEEADIEVDKPILQDSIASNVQTEKAPEKQVIEPAKDVSNDFGGTGYQGDGDNYANIDDYENKDTIVKTPTKNKEIIENTRIDDSLFKNSPLGYREVSIPDVEGDNDHFLTVFLTGVMLVVFIYVLYHNKSKVTKVVLGLIVEGRNSNRRRNSRGHSYRRLDTLEQAMSTDTTAPPTKIIY